MRWDWTAWKGRTRDKIRGEAGKVYISPRYLIPMYTLYAVRYTLYAIRYRIGKLAS